MIHPDPNFKSRTVYDQYLTRVISRVKEPLNPKKKHFTRNKSRKRRIVRWNFESPNFIVDK